MRYFLDCAKAGYYSSPNKVIPKKERSNWRFKVKRYYKELTKTIPTIDIGVKSTKLLIELHELVSRGTNTLVFTNWDTFRALGVNQVEYLDMLYKRILSTGNSINNIKVCIDLLDNCKDPDILDEFLINVFIDNLRTEESKLTAINLLDEKVVEVKEKYKTIQRYKDVLAVTDGRLVPEWLTANHDALSGTVVAKPTRAQIDVPVEETLIVELYSK